MKRRWITLTTDFGLEDWFVGTMKGVIGAIAPHAPIVDLTHGIPPGDIQAGAFALASGFRFFPRGTVHLAIVDPGVGTDRPALAVRTRDYFFVGPDNGLLSVALAQQEVQEIRQITNRRWMLNDVSQTFHGRDVFAPAAANLALGRAFSGVGRAARSMVRLDLPEPQAGQEQVLGAVVYLDRYGNAITNIRNEGFLRSDRAADVFVRQRRISRIHDCYQAVPPGKPVCVPGSSGYLEIAVNQGDASRQLRLKVGSTVTVRW
jgi:hypothetical protein